MQNTIILGKIKDEVFWTLSLLAISGSVKLGPFLRDTPEIICCYQIKDPSPAQCGSVV